MTDQTVLIDENRAAFEEWWKNANPCNSLERDRHDPELYFTAFAQYGWQAWQAAREHCVPQLTEAETVEILAKSITESNYPGFHSKTKWIETRIPHYRDDAKKAVQALVAAGVQFKPDRTEGTEQ